MTKTVGGVGSGYYLISQSDIIYGRPLMLMNPYCYFETQVVTCFLFGELLAKMDVLMGGVVKPKYTFLGGRTLQTAPMVSD